MAADRLSRPFHDTIPVADGYEYRSHSVFPVGRGMAHICGCRRGMVPASNEPKGSNHGDERC